MPLIMLSKLPDGTSTIAPMNFTSDTADTFPSVSTPDLYWFDALNWMEIREGFIQDIDNFKEQQRQDFKLQNRLIKLERTRTIDRRINRRRGCVLGHGKRGRV